MPNNEKCFWTRDNRVVLKNVTLDLQAKPCKIEELSNKHNHTIAIFPLSLTGNFKKKLLKNVAKLCLLFSLVLASILYRIENSRVYRR